jgi:hypothetical protein
MIKLPKGLLTLSEAAEKYGFNAGTLKDYVNRDRLEAIKSGGVWYTTDRAMKKYMGSRDLERIPKRYRKRR